MGYLDPPEPPDPHPNSEDLCELLENAAVEQSVIDKSCALLDELANELKLLLKECEYCEARREAERLTDAQQFERVFNASAAAFVIEDTGGASPSYWTGQGPDKWSFNHDDAMRFSRKQDAERALGWLVPAKHYTRVSEHIWTQ